MIYVTKTELPEIEDYERILRDIWQSGWLTNDGKYVKLLEKKLAAYLKIRYISVITNGTIALQILYKALHLKGEVITTPFTFAATTTSLLWEGLTPVFADIDPSTFNIAPTCVEKCITKKTGAILAVHVFGNPCDVTTLSKIGKKYHIPVVYDAAHAFGVEYDGKSVLSYGDASIVSFHATKLFSTAEGGAVVASDPELDGNVRRLRNFGITGEEDSVMPGTNGKMCELCAALGLLNIRKTNKRILLRKRLYTLYQKALEGTSGIQFQRVGASKYNYAYMPVLFSNRTIRDRVHDALIHIGVKSRKYFYPLVTDQTFMNTRIHNQTPCAKKVSDGILCLPLFSTLRPSTINAIADKIKDTLT